jgi:HTH-type transcriptional regulator/antitoxin HigA
MKPIITVEDYQLALKRLEVVFDAPIGTPESDEADELGMMFDEFEQTHYPMHRRD